MFLFKKKRPPGEGQARQGPVAGLAGRLRGRRRAQARRILDLLEIEAFQELHRQWQRLGYPVASLTPSLATAIGSSGDRPAALAELMGTIVQGGVRYPSRLVTGLHFAAGTPYAADDPKYLLWTLAPLFQSADLIYRLYVGDLDRDERDALWQDHRLVGRLFGLTSAEMPATIEEFDEYFEEMLHGGELWVTPRARELGTAVVFHPTSPPRQESHHGCDDSDPQIRQRKV